MLISIDFIGSGNTGSQRDNFIFSNSALTSIIKIGIGEFRDNNGELEAN